MVRGPHYFNKTSNDDLWNLRPRRGRGRYGEAKVPDNVEFSANWKIDDDTICSHLTFNKADFIFDDVSQNKSCLSKRTDNTEEESDCTEEQQQKQYGFYVAYLRYKREHKEETRKPRGILGRYLNAWSGEPTLEDFVPDGNGIVRIKGEGRFFFPRDPSTNEIICMKI